MAVTKKKRFNEFPSPYTVKNAWKDGGAITKLSMVLMGAGNFAHRQIAKGLIFLAAEIVFIAFMVYSGLHNLGMLVTLGELEQQEVWNEAKGIYEYVAGDNSLLILLYGVVTLFVVAWFFLTWRAAVKSAYKAEYLAKNGKHVNSLMDDLKDLFHTNLHKTLLTLPVAGVLIFNIVPLIFMISMAFTSYSKQGDHLVLFDWVGLENFIKVLNFSDAIGQTFWSVLGWTLV